MDRLQVWALSKCQPFCEAWDAPATSGMASDKAPSEDGVAVPSFSDVNRLLSRVSLAWT